MPRITISYRRDDSGVITGRIFDRLAAHYGRDSVFRDIDNIPPGADFRRHIEETLDASEIVLAIIGPRWVGQRANQSRLANAADPVRVEIETALRKNKAIIPVLVLSAKMPQPEYLPDSLKDLAFRHALTIDAGQDFDIHVARLTRAVDRLLVLEAEGSDLPLGERVRQEPEFADLSRQLMAARELAASKAQAADEAFKELLEREHQTARLEAEIGALQLKLQSPAGSPRALYAVEFGDAASGLYVNGGVAVLDGNRVFGGDSGFYYNGHFSIQDDQISATVKVTRHNPDWHQNAFADTAGSFTVQLRGKIKDGVMNGAMERNGVQLPVRLTWKENLS